MKQIVIKYLRLLIFSMPCSSFFGLTAQNLFNENTVQKFEILMHPDSVIWLYENIYNERYLNAIFVFHQKPKNDTIKNVGVKLRGNTSLKAKKKSFKISFNEFVPGREYGGEKKLNLNGQHNDPTLIREKLYYEIWNSFGMPKRKSAFVQLFINGKEMGVYTNIEELDKDWLIENYKDNDGNLYKCTYPADLAYINNNQNSYKNIQSGAAGESRAYELKTNEDLDDYSDLVELISKLNATYDSYTLEQLQSVLDLNTVLKAYAIDISTGNWDDYFYNKNNYFLYKNTLNKKFYYMAYDTDNSSGVDWLNKDWATRNVFTWHTANRNLISKLLIFMPYKYKLSLYLDSLTNQITDTSKLFPKIRHMQKLIAPFVATDTFRKLDYGYTLQDFYNGYTSTIDNHTPYGIFPFYIKRNEQTQLQIAKQLLKLESLDGEVKIRYSNKTINFIPQTKTKFPKILVYDTHGKCQLQQIGRSVNIEHLPLGVYWIEIQDGNQNYTAKILHQ